MYTHIYQNSYIVTIILFVALCVIFYFLQIGTKKEIVNGKVTNKFSWKYPLAISLVVWLFWHFYMYPQIDTNPKEDFTDKINFAKNEKLVDKKIIMDNWI